MSKSSNPQLPRILIADDTELLRRMARDALEATGHEVVEVENGEQALAAWEEYQPDLLLLDVNMPLLDGCGACETVREADPNIPILMMTAADDADSIRRAYEAGATDFIPKPINWLILSQRVRYMLRMADAVERLRTSEKRLAKAQRTAHLGNWELDLQSGDFLGSDELLQLYGLRPSLDVRPSDLLHRIVDSDQRAVGDALSRALRRAQGGGIGEFGVDHRVNLPNGETRFIYLQGEVAFDAQNQPYELSGTAQDVTDRKRAEAEARFLAYHDTLTRLGNRHLFRERLDYSLAQARRHQTIVAVIVLDLDHFKRINDTFGHPVGDNLLVSVADRLTNCVREGDFVSRSLPDDAGPTVSRFGGDEFMLSLSSVRNAAEVGQVTERILEVLSRPYDVEGTEIVVTASAGVSVSPSDGDDVDTLLHNADAAMYYAKGQGRGHYQFYKPSMSELAGKNLELESELRAALQNEQFILHYQPKVELPSGRITGFEALVRWQHPEKGLVPPNAFLPVAEQAGLIVPLGELVLRTACEQTKHWREMGFNALRMSVNMSAHQFCTEAIFDTVVRVLRETPLSPRSLDVEITESTMMENQGVAVDSLQRMKGIGVTVSLDDFGTGYSSLSYLKGFPVDTVKIDRSFVRDVTTDPDTAAITRAIISMAHALSLNVVAEGVETEAQLEFLAGCGCDEIQGYLFSRPVPADEAQYILENGGHWMEGELGEMLKRLTSS
ncbi:MAG: EAL domain-containing protein [Deltaproteobacteria bacterium]|nr:EAL domain-containing protein [Deltaproteobacteria bacterium]MBW2413256.1 EAL domain-containing protein [Deltaproteobacteria bacterium]